MTDFTADGRDTTDATMYALQSTLVDLLTKNQRLRMDLSEAEVRLAAIENILVEKISWKDTKVTSAHHLVRMLCLCSSQPCSTADAQSIEVAA